MFRLCQILITTLSLWGLQLAAAYGASYSYSTTWSSSIPDGTGSNVCGTAITRTYYVSDSFTIEDLNVGVVATHPYKEDLLISLSSPIGTSVDIIDREGTSFENYNVSLDDEASVSIGNIDHNISETHPEYTRLPSNALNAFDGESSVGNWTLTVQDCSNTDTGSLHGHYLNFTSAPPPSPLVVTSTADTNSLGSLRYAITHANANAADDEITFNIPTSDSGYDSVRGVFVIPITYDLPAITDDGISINGSSQTTNQGNTNTGNIVSVTTVGVNNTSIAAVAAPEIEIDGFDWMSTGLNIDSADNVTLSGMAILGMQTAIRVRNGATNTIIEDMVVGAQAHNISDPGASERVDSGVSIEQNNTTAIIRNSVFANADTGRAISVGTAGQHSYNSLTVQSVHFINNGLARNSSNGAIEILQNLSPTLSISGNRFVAPSSSSDIGVEINPFSTGGTSCVSCIIEDNSFDGFNRAFGIFSDQISNVTFQRNIVTNSLASALSIGALTNGSIENNSISGSGNNGIDLYDPAARVSIISNSIFSNTGLGIDLGSNDISNNDLNDIDSGTNNFLNFPEVNEIQADGTTLINYDFNLDVPNNADGYRIEFFKNSTAHSSGYGEGETYLGYVDIAHAGGDLNFTGTLATTAIVSSDDYISATTTRKTASSFDITSEFAETYTATAPPSPLIVTSTADTNTIGTLRYAINHANANAADDNITFDIPGAGPHTFALSSELPKITDAGVTIDGTSQPGASCGQLTTGTQHTIMIQLDLSAAVTNGTGLKTNASNVTIAGLSITNAERYGVRAETGSDNFVLECSYLGVEPDGITKGPNAQDGGVNPAVRIESDNATIRNSLISGNDTDASDDGLRFLGASGGIIEGNIIGLDVTGSSDLGNGDTGILIDNNASGITIGGITSATRNVISGNDGNGIEIINSSDINILGNYIGLDSTGNSDLGNGEYGIRGFAATDLNIGGEGSNDGNIISGNDLSGLYLDTGNDISLLGNSIGTNAGGTSEIGNNFNGVVADNIDNLVIGNSVAGNIFVNSATCCSNIFLGGSTNSTIENNKFGVSADETTLLGLQYSAIYAASSGSTLIGDGTTSGKNIIANGTNSGITVTSSGPVAILANEIRDNIGIGIDLGDNALTLNDENDTDTGSNNLLNFPVINEIGAEGANSIDYDFNLDVPNDVNGYRIEFFKNDSAHSTGYGEGEVYLGFLDIAHGGGDINFTGTLSTNVPIDVDDVISATTTRKTASSFDITSEFSLSATTITSNPASLTVAKTVAPLNAGDYDLPGSDVVYTFTVTNEGGGAVDTDSIVLIDSLPSEIIFYFGDHDGPGPSTDVVGFEESNTSLSFDPNADALFSDDPTKPSDLSECDYTPSAGYDPNVKYVCFNPKGAMLGGDPNPNFNIRFRARIQ